MSDKLNITEFEQLLQDQLSTAEVPAPSGVWDGMADALEQLNSELQFDHQLQDQLQEAQVEAPTEVWQAVQQSVAVQSGGLLSSIAAKWILGIGASAVLTAGILYFTTPEKSIPEIQTEELLPEPNSITEKQLEVIDGAETIQNTETRGSEKASGETASNQDLRNQGTPITASPNSVSYGQGGGSTSGSTNGGGQTHSSSGRGTDNGSSVKALAGQNARNQALFVVMSYLSEDTSVCDGTRFELQVQEGNFTKMQVWIDQQAVQTLTAPGSISLSELKPGVYQLRFVAFKGEESVQRALKLRVHEKPKAELYVEEYGKGKYVFSMNVASAMQYNWFLDGQNAGLGNFWEHQFRDFAEKKHRVVLAMKTPQGCQDSAIKEFINSAVIEIKEPKLYNLFTPNGDGYGDVFQLEVSGETYWKLSIYNSQKAKVFESDDPMQGWNGVNQYSGSACREGQYYCVLTYTLHGQKMKTEQWYITLMR